MTTEEGSAMTGIVPTAAAATGREIVPAQETLRVLTGRLWTYSGNAATELKSAATWVAEAKHYLHAHAIEVPDSYYLEALMAKLTGVAFETANEAQLTSSEQLFDTLMDAFPRRGHQVALIGRIASGDAFKGLTKLNAVVRLNVLAKELSDQQAGLVGLATAVRTMFEAPWARVGTNPELITMEELEQTLIRLKEELARDPRVEPQLFGRARTQVQAPAPRPVAASATGPGRAQAPTPAASATLSHSGRRRAAQRSKVQRLEAEMATMRLQLQQQAPRQQAPRPQQQPQPRPSAGN